jgi:cytochrome d ubiquinol oxidase subunit II
MSLPEFWFVLIAVLWGGYFVLEGFDFGVGILLPILPRDERERGVMFDAIGPVWDGNEVWLVVAAGATFAAFPAWYGTMFSGFYLALLLILVCLIVRVVSFEWRAKSEDVRWRRVWLWANTAGSIGAPFSWGIALASLLHGVPLNASHGYAGDVLDLFTGYSVLAGVVVVCLFAFHGATYLGLRTLGRLRDRAATAAHRLAIPAALLVIAFVVWTVLVAHERNARGIGPVAVPAALTVVVMVLAVVFTRARRGGWAFAMTALGSIGVVASVFTGLYPRVLVSHPNFANSLTISNAAAGHYGLKVITVVALIFTPLVLLYQGWTYYVFRQRLGGRSSPSDDVQATPAA